MEWEARNIFFNLSVLFQVMPVSVISLQTELTLSIAFED